MAIHDDSAALSREVIEEYIELARIGLNFKKADDGCLGYPSTLLMFCIIDALSNHLGFSRMRKNRLDRPILLLALMDGE